MSHQVINTALSFILNIGEQQMKHFLYHWARKSMNAMRKTVAGLVISIFGLMLFPALSTALVLHASHQWEKYGTLFFDAIHVTCLILLFIIFLIPLFFLRETLWLQIFGLPSQNQYTRPCTTTDSHLTGTSHSHSKDDKNAHLTKEEWVQMMDELLDQKLAQFIKEK